MPPCPPDSPPPPWSCPLVVWWWGGVVVWRLWSMALWFMWFMWFMWSMWSMWSTGFMSAGNETSLLSHAVIVLYILKLQFPWCFGVSMESQGWGRRSCLSGLHQQVFSSRQWPFCAWLQWNLKPFVFSGRSLMCHRSFRPLCQFSGD